MLHTCMYLCKHYYKNWKSNITRIVCKLQKFYLILFSQKFRESIGFTKGITNELIWRKRKFFDIPHCETRSHYRNFREINSLVNTLIWRKNCWFFWKNWDPIYSSFYVHCNMFPEHSVEFAEILSHTFFAKISWKQWFY